MMSRKSSSSFFFSFVVCICVLALSSFERPAHGLDCSEFDASQIKLVTFDTFAALTLLPQSLNRSVRSLLPQLNDTQYAQVVDSWITAYAENLGHSFDITITGPFPFRWMVNTSIVEILEGLNVTIDSETLVDLENSWGDLIPRPGANVTLEALQGAGFEVGPLSNGDYYTLEQAFKVFAPQVIPDYVFSSDYPVMCFKNCSKIYQHVLNTTGYDATQYLHVAGSMYDGEGARGAGVFSAVLEAPEEDEPSFLGTDMYNPANMPCFFLRNLTDILPILGVPIP